MLKSRTFIATPAYRGEVVMQYAHCLVRDSILAIAAGHFINPPYAINDTLIHNARNHALKAFLESDLDNLVFIDADMGWEEGALVRLIEASGDVVCGLYRTKEDNENYPFSSLPQGFNGGEILAGPTGFMKITRGCAERISKLHERPFEFVGTKGEDIVFCERVHEAGMKIMGLADIHFEHVGPKVWSGRASDFLFPKAKAA